MHHRRETRDQGTLKTSMTRDAGRSIANVGERNRKRKRQDIGSQKIISVGLCEVCKVLRLDEGSVTTCRTGENPDREMYVAIDRSQTAPLKTCQKQQRGIRMGDVTGLLSILQLSKCSRVQVEGAV